MKPLSNLSDELCQLGDMRSRVLLKLIFIYSSRYYCLSAIASVMSTAPSHVRRYVFTCLLCQAYGNTAVVESVSHELSLTA